jgi:hypothetical protein
VDGSFALGVLLLALAAAPLWAASRARRRRTLGLFRAFRFRRVTPPPEFAGPRVSAFELRIGGQVSGTWRPWPVRLLLGRNGVILGMDLTLLAGLALLAEAVDDRGFGGIVVAIASAPLTSAIVAVAAMSSPSPAVESSRRDVAAAWFGGFVLAATLAVTWLATWLVGLGLILNSG